mmetsp:Transcript_26357/g.67191  ORF Transcript_26357/g.67191 Transcript_26357/m.67191 type:complete len:153 (+) Transcript_26357:678-1136(+)
MAQFGKFFIPDSHIFYRTTLSFAFVNLRPVVAGHVLVSPLRQVARVKDMTEAEVGDMFVTAQKVAGVVEGTFRGTSATITVQDGPEAGQSVPHVHVHILPRKQGDFERNDDVYDEIDRKRIDNDERTDRSERDMAEEAAMLRTAMQKEHREA